MSKPSESRSNQYFSTVEDIPPHLKDFCLERLGDVCEDDLLFVCNEFCELDEVYSNGGWEPTDAKRISSVQEDDGWDDWYKNIIAESCCGQADEQITNPLTGNSFWIGLNYGH